MSNWQTVLELGKALPEVEESTWFNTPSLKVRGKSFVRLKEDDVIVVMVDEEEKEVLLRCAKCSSSRGDARLQNAC